MKIEKALLINKSTGERQVKNMNTERECDRCIHRKESGCEKWNCQFEPKDDLIRRQDAIDAVNYHCESLKDIKRAITALPSANHWIPVKFRPLTEEEQKEYPDYCYMADCMMPDDEEEILVTVKSSRGHLCVRQDVCYFDDGFSLDSGYDWQTDVIAWMPLPEPWEGEE